MFKKQIAQFHYVLLVASAGITSLLNSCNSVETVDASDASLETEDPIVYTVNQNSKLKTIRVKDNKMIILEANDKIHIHKDRN